MTLGAVQFDLIAPGKRTSYTQGPVKIYKLGYLWFDIDGYHHNLQYVRFDKQIFIPDTPIITGYGFQLFPGVNGTFTTIYTKLKDDPFTVAGNVISFYEGKVLGLGNIGINGTIEVYPTITQGTGNLRLKG